MRGHRAGQPRPVHRQCGAVHDRIGDPHSGSAVINIVRQIGFAVGVTIFVAVLGAPESVVGNIGAFRRAWWVMAVITAIGLFPLLWLRASKTTSPRQSPGA
ncbi:MAG: hypothetical protein R3E83_07290 [Burkholderiaceae bacterium]